MRIDVAPSQNRRGRRLERFAVLGAVLAVGGVLGAAVGALRPGAEGSVSAMARTLVDGPPAEHLPQLQLDLHFRGLQSLRELRQTWREHGVRPTPEPSAVQAGVRQGQTEVDVALSLLGPAQSSAPGPLGRFFIDVHGVGTVFGMRAATVENPTEPLLLRQLLLAQTLTLAHAAAPRMQAVGLRVNGDRWGAAILVEQPSQAMVLAAKRPAGAIVGWDVPLPDGNDVDTREWLPVAPPARWATGLSTLRATPLEFHVAWAQGRLDALRSGQLPVGDVLDVEATARLVALAELTGLADRVVTWQRLRWYLNPQTLRLEPLLSIGPELAGPSVRDDALLPLLLRAPPLRQALATILRAEAVHLMSPDAEARVAAALALAWPTLLPATLQHEWQLVRQRAMRAMAAEALAADMPAPTTPSAAILAPFPPTAEIAP